MEYILIDSDKLKIILEQSDLELWSITADALDYSQPPAKKVFEDILGLAKKELGFDTAGRRVLLELYPSRDGGCELFLTRLPEHIDDCLEDMEEAMPQKKHLTSAYSFENVTELLSAARQLKKREIVKKSTLWHDSDRWYLLLECKNDTLKDFEPFSLSPLSFLSEYGKNEAYKQIAPYLSEYASLICKKNAVEFLGSI